MEFKSATFQLPALNIKGLVHPKMKISLCFIYPQSILGVYDFLLSDASNQSYIKNCPGTSMLYNCSRRVFLFNSPEDVPHTAPGCE